MKALLLPAYPAAPAAPSFVGRAAAALRTLPRANAPLAWAGYLNVALALLALALLPFDHRVVTGLPMWLKPLKFAVSIVAYAWALAWLLGSLPAAAQGAARRIGWGVAASMVVEQAVIFAQAARGTTSHYNVATPFDGALFGLMGVFIVVNTVLAGWAVVLVWRHRPRGAASYVWGARLGLLVFWVGSVLGGFMIHNNQHTVGAPDGGPGLPGLGWSTAAGDLRLAHFLGMHALQALPLLGWALRGLRPRRGVALLAVGAALYAAAVAGLLGQALAGHSAF